MENNQSGFLPILKDFIRRHRRSNEALANGSNDLNFIYQDTDSHSNEIAELYSYTELPEFALNVHAFEEQMEQYQLVPSWQRLTIEQQRSVIMKLVDQLDMSSRALRMCSARCILYLAQGCWAEVQSDTEQLHLQRTNVMLLYQHGVFASFIELLNIEIEKGVPTKHVATRKVATSLMDSQDLRLILSVLNVIAEVIRNEKEIECTEYQEEIDAFTNDILSGNGEDLLIVKLLLMVTKFCSGIAPQYPMKKVLLLLWKLLLISLGGTVKLRHMRHEKRIQYGLPVHDEDTMGIINTMRACSPPASASDMIGAQNSKRNMRPLKRSLAKQSSLDDQDNGFETTNSMSDDIHELIEYDDQQQNLEDTAMYDDAPTTASASNSSGVISSASSNGLVISTHEMETNGDSGDNGNGSEQQQHSSPLTIRPIVYTASTTFLIPRGLPWKPKVRQKDVEQFLEAARIKFIGYNLPNDMDSLAGLPLPIHEGIKVLREHVYTPLAESQILEEDRLNRTPLLLNAINLDDGSGSITMVARTPTEIYYEAMLPNLPQYMIALLKILLAAAPTSKAKNDSINIMADLLPVEMPLSVLQSMKLGIDVNRHKEIIVKSVSGILLLFLKHFKLNHIYQFEFMSQHLVFANCIPLVLKFFNQNIMAYIGSRNTIPILDFPSCMIGDQPELTTECLEIGDESALSYSWRNMFSCINLLRILNKLTKWKHSRIMMMVVFKSAPILKRTLKIRHAMTQLYVLKLLKMQTKYLGRQWRKSNMRTISAIYQKVRHRLNDDWAYGNDLDARPWDFQAEECALRNAVDRFNNRRYIHNDENNDFASIDTSVNSVLGMDIDLSDNFKKNYEVWLEQEVFTEPIVWEKLLNLPEIKEN